MKYSDIDGRKKAFLFELDNVIYPEKDYLLQVYYLFASFIEYTDLKDAKAMTDLMAATYYEKGNAAVFNAVKEQFSIDEKYRVNFLHMLLTAKLPLKLLIYKDVLNLMQELVIDRKQLFIITNGNPTQQLNKIKQTEWNGLEAYLTCYFAEEIKPKPKPDVVDQLLKDHNLQRRDIVMIGNSETDVQTAEACGIDYIAVSDFML